MYNESSMKELYDLTLKATYPIEMGNKTFQPGEVIARFDKIQISNFQEITNRTTAHGGWDDRDHVFWEDPKQIQINFVQGIFSKRQFALLCNSKMIYCAEQSNITIPKQYIGESDENGELSVGKQNILNVFVYNAKTYEKIEPILVDAEKGKIKIGSPYTDVQVDFDYIYQGSTQMVRLGEKAIQGYLLLEGKTRVKDDITGKNRTAIIRIPRLKLVSDLSMRLGREASPMVASFNAIGLPLGEKGSKKIMEMYFLEDDIDAEI